MMDVYWLEQTEADLPAGNDWLNATESLRLQGMRFAKRRADWRLGRWTAKRALAVHLHLSDRSLTEIEVRPAPSGAPEVLFANQPADVAISLSHRAGVAVCAIATGGTTLGCDLEAVEPRSAAFTADYFTAQEQALVARACDADRAGLLALLWSGKESALKALRAGLRLDTRCVTVDLVDDGEKPAAEELAFTFPAREPNRWHRLQVRCDSGPILQGWWQHSENLVRTLVAAPPPVPPILLNAPRKLWV